MEIKPVLLAFDKPWDYQPFSYKLKIKKDLGECVEEVEDDKGDLVKSLVHKYKVEICG